VIIKLKDLLLSEGPEDKEQEKQQDPFQKLKIDIPEDPFDDTIKEVGAGPQYKKLYKDIVKAENQLAKSVDKMALFLNKKGLKNQSMMLKGNYIQDVRDFVDKFLKGFIKDLM